MTSAPVRTQWTSAQATEWYQAQPWLVGCNFTPSSAINQLEMFQAETFDPDIIDRELELAAAIGMNTVRTYLHDLLWEEAGAFCTRLDRFLQIASRHGIRPMLVLLDDCWHAGARRGTQPRPQPGIHNSGWLQSPGLEIVNAGPEAWERIEAYVTGVMARFAADGRILLWDLYNEPGNNGNDERSLPLLEAAFQWARQADVSQPITCGVWSDVAAIRQCQLANSDVVTFHDYEPPDHLHGQIAELGETGRPLICTEWMARTRGCLVETNLPVFKEEGVGCLNWGLVDGKTQTKYAWDDPRPGAEPDPWFHELFRADLTPYRAEEVALFRTLTSP